MNMAAKLLMDEEEEAVGEVFPGLPNCLAFDILSRIPSSKQLSVFKCVSKTWLRYISDPYFTALHSTRSDQNPPSYCILPIPFDQVRNYTQFISSPNVQCSDPRFGKYEIEYDIEFDVTLHIQTADHDGEPVTQFSKLIRAHEDPYLSLLPSNKQLLCISTSYRIYICNPGTQDFIELPRGSCHPFCLYNIGFGYLPDSMEYKVVRLFYTHMDEDWSARKLGCEVMTISSLTKNNYEWRVMDEACPYAVDSHGSVTVNGFVFWEVEEAFILLDEEYKNDFILSFDLAKEKIGILPPPPCNKLVGFGIAGIKNDLYFVDYGESEYIMNMWIMKDWKTFQWSKKYSISFEDTGAWFYRRPLDIININGEEVILIYWKGNLYYYYVENKVIILLGTDGYDIKFCYYHDSFFSLIKTCN